MEIDRLLTGCDSDLDRRWLRPLDAHQLVLPTHAQKIIDACRARRDSLYGPNQHAGFIDGARHDEPQRRLRRAKVDECLKDIGDAVECFLYDEEVSWGDCWTGTRSFAARGDEPVRHPADGPFRGVRPGVPAA